MNCFNRKYTSWPDKVTSIILIFIFFFSVEEVFTQEKSKEKSKPKRYEVEVGLDAVYDDNILKYSDKYLERFMDGMDFGRFHIETYDDMILKPSFKFTSTFNFFKKQKTKFSFDYSYSAYIVNDIKNWQGIGISVNQSFLKRASFRISYNYIPDFYVRHFRDEDLVQYYEETTGFGYIPETFVPFSFAKDNIGFWIQNTFFKNTRLRLVFDYARYFHNEHYTEYDCKNLMYGFQINQAITKELKVDLGFEFTNSRAKGYDEPGETLETSDDADANNVANGFLFGLSYQLPKIMNLKSNLNAGLDYDLKYYTTDNYVEVDPEHAGRVDNSLAISVNYNVEISKSFSIGAFYKWSGRDSYTSSEINSNYVSNEKDYKQNQVGLELSYGLKF
jgi:hypothetical protein